jgi:hypothetical protein
MKPMPRITPMAASVCQQTDDTLEDVDRSRPCTTRLILVSTRAFAVTRGYLPGQASLILDPSQMIVTGAGWTGLGVTNRARTLRNQYLRDSLWRITLWYIGAPSVIGKQPALLT